MNYRKMKWSFFFNFFVEIKSFVSFVMFEIGNNLIEE